MFGHVRAGIVGGVPSQLYCLAGRGVTRVSLGRGQSGERFRPVSDGGNKLGALQRTRSVPVPAFLGGNRAQENIPDMLIRGSRNTLERLPEVAHLCHV